jgi:hypothetical protein
MSPMMLSLPSSSSHSSMPRLRGFRSFRKSRVDTKWRWYKSCRRVRDVRVRTSHKPWHGRHPLQPITVRCIGYFSGRHQSNTTHNGADELIVSMHAYKSFHRYRHVPSAMVVRIKFDARRNERSGSTQAMGDKQQETTRTRRTHTHTCG